MSNTWMPDDATLAALRERSADEPVVMLNLLKYEAEGGREAFARYGAVSGPLIAKAGASVVYAAPAGATLAGPGEATDWDDVILVRFPSGQAFLDMINSEEYRQRAVPHRAEALERTLWMATHPAQPARESE